MNRLAKEQSPYLLQHANNPVDWYPWGEDAFARARREDKPIFLSIGYSTCHWCHVMEHESFESPEIAEVLNRDFVSIKVDREERPDVDRVYMTFVQTTTGSGGWPMSVWLNTELRPFYGGTYYPPAAQWGRPGFVDVLKEIARAWRENRAQIDESAASITERLASMAAGEGGGDATTALGPDALAATVRQFQQLFDQRRGGFGDAPKFPRPSELLLLLREHARTGVDAPKDMVLTTLRAMALGGMRDHIGGGFHRYSVDGNWRVPHFEKMLYDQAQLAIAYLEAAQVSNDSFFAQIAEDTLQYVRRDMTDDGGGFFSAEDADSVPHERAHESNPPRTEGAFYIWSQDEIRAALGDDARLFELRYGILAGGNAPFDPHNEFEGKNILYTARGIAEIAQEMSTAPEQVADALMRARVTLFEVRATRPRPRLDDKVLTCWNGLMIGAFARAGRVLDSRHVDTAARAADFIHRTMWDPAPRGLLRRYRQGAAAIDAYAEDFAFLIFGLVELFQSSGDVRWLDWAIDLQRRQDELFWDPVDGGWFSTTGRDESVLIRMKEDYDGAEPSASGVGAWNLLALAHLTGETDYETRAQQVFRAFAARLSSQGRALPMMSAALSISMAPPEQVVVIGDRSDDGFARLWHTANERYRPFAHMIPIQSGSERERLGTVLPWVAGMSVADGRATAYVCRNFVCEAPTHDPDRVR